MLCFNINLYIIFLSKKTTYPKYICTLTNSIIMTLKFIPLALGNILPYSTLNVMKTRMEYTNNIIP